MAVNPKDNTAVMFYMRPLSRIELTEAEASPDPTQYKVEQWRRV